MDNPIEQVGYVVIMVCGMLIAGILLWSWIVLPFRVGAMLRLLTEIRDDARARAFAEARAEAARRGADRQPTLDSTFPNA